MHVALRLGITCNRRRIWPGDLVPGGESYVDESLLQTLVWTQLLGTADRRLQIIEQPHIFVVSATLYCYCNRSGEPIVLLKLTPVTHISPDPGALFKFGNEDAEGSKRDSSHMIEIEEMIGD